MSGWRQKLGGITLGTLAAILSLRRSRGALEKLYSILAKDETRARYGKT